MDIVVRAVAVFAMIFLITRTVGRRELSLSQPFDLILLIVLGDLIQQGVTQSDQSLTGAVLAVSTFTLLTVSVSFVSFRSRPLRTVLEGQPLILIDGGTVINENLKSQRLALDEVLSEARLQQVGKLEDIRWAILETNGSISIIPESS